LVQEALTNVKKHAAATTVRVEARVTGDLVDVSVSDDGRGFDLEVATGGFGLAGMRERAALGGGALDLSSGPAGTTVRATFRASAPDLPTAGRAAAT
jgi:signal transduction histidine kinase